MSPLSRQGWFFLAEFFKWYFWKYWQVRTRPVFAQAVTLILAYLVISCLILQYLRVLLNVPNDHQIYWFSLLQILMLDFLVALTNYKEE